MNEFDFELPEGIEEKDLVPDPSKRVGHWLHTPSGEVFSCPKGWEPKKGKRTAKAAESAAEPEPEA